MLYNLITEEHRLLVSSEDRRNMVLALDFMEVNEDEAYLRSNLNALNAEYSEL